MRFVNKIVSFAMVIILGMAYPILVSADDNVESKIGSIEIVLEKGGVDTSNRDVSFEYGKVATLENGTYKILKPYEALDVEFNDIKLSTELDKVAIELNKYLLVDGVVKTNQDGKAHIPDLEEGIYLLRVSDKALYDNVQPALVGIPTWNEETKMMDYRVTVVPKHSPDKPEKIITGDEQSYIKYIGISIISFILVVGLTCHNRFKCGKIAGNYSEQGGYTHGNDNDSEDPRRTRRIRSRGGRSIN